MCLYLPRSAAIAWTKIFKMASSRHFQLLFFSMKSYNFHSIKMKFGKYLPIKVPNEYAFSRICKCCRDWDIQDGVQQPFWIIVLCIKSIKFIMKKWKFAHTIVKRCPVSANCSNLQLFQGSKYSRWRPEAILDYSLIHESFILHKTKVKFGEYLSVDAMNEYICAKNCNFCREQDFQNGAWQLFAIIVFHKSWPSTLQRWNLANNFLLGFWKGVPLPESAAYEGNTIFKMVSGSHF